MACGQAHHAERVAPEQPRGAGRAATKSRLSRRCCPRTASRTSAAPPRAVLELRGSRPGVVLERLRDLVAWSPALRSRERQRGVASARRRPRGRRAEDARRRRRSVLDRLGERGRETSRPSPPRDQRSSSDPPRTTVAPMLAAADDRGGAPVARCGRPIARRTSSRQRGDRQPSPGVVLAGSEGSQHHRPPSVSLHHLTGDPDPEVREREQIGRARRSFLSRCGHQPAGKRIERERCRSHQQHDIVAASPATNAQQRRPYPAESTALDRVDLPGARVRDILDQPFATDPR